MISKILSFLLNGGIARVGEQIRLARKDALNAKNAAEKLEAEQYLAELKAKQIVLIAEQKDWRTAWIRPAIALPIVLFIWKIIVWDKMLEWGTTPDLSDKFWWLFYTVVGAFFLVRPFEKRRK